MHGVAGLVRRAGALQISMAGGDEGWDGGSKVNRCPTLLYAWSGDVQYLYMCRGAPGGVHCSSGRPYGRPGCGVVAQSALRSAVPRAEQF